MKIILRDICDDKHFGNISNKKKGCHLCSKYLRPVGAERWCPIHLLGFNGKTDVSGGYDHDEVWVFRKSISSEFIPVQDVEFDSEILKPLIPEDKYKKILENSINRKFIK